MQNAAKKTKNKETKRKKQKTSCKMLGANLATTTTICTKVHSPLTLFRALPLSLLGGSLLLSFLATAVQK